MDSSTRDYGVALVNEGLKVISTDHYQSHEYCFTRFAEKNKNEKSLNMEDIITASCRKFVTKLCVSFHEPLLSAAERNKYADDGETRLQMIDKRIQLVIDDRSSTQIINDWNLNKIAKFLIPFASLIGPVWTQSTDAILWSLKILKYNILHKVMSAADTLNKLGSYINTSYWHKAVVDKITKILSNSSYKSEGIGEDEKEIREMEENTQQIKDIFKYIYDHIIRWARDNKSDYVEFALAAGALALLYSSKGKDKETTVYERTKMISSFLYVTQRMCGSDSIGLLPSLSIIDTFYVTVQNDVSGTMPCTPKKCMLLLNYY